MMVLFAAKASSSSLSSSKLINYQLKNEEEEDEKRKSSRVSQERQRTLDRLRTFKQVCALLFTGGVSVYVIIFCSPTPLCLFLAVPGSGDSEVHSATRGSQHKKRAKKRGNE